MRTCIFWRPSPVHCSWEGRSRINVQSQRSMSCTISCRPVRDFPDCTVLFVLFCSMYSTWYRTTCLPQTWGLTARLFNPIWIEFANSFQPGRTCHDCVRDLGLGRAPRKFGGIAGSSFVQLPVSQSSHWIALADLACRCALSLADLVYSRLSLTVEIARGSRLSLRATLARSRTRLDPEKHADHLKCVLIEMGVWTVLRKILVSSILQRGCVYWRFTASRVTDARRVDDLKLVSSVEWYL